MEGPQPIGASGFAHSGAHLAVSQRFGIENQTDVSSLLPMGQLNGILSRAAGHWRGPQTIGAAGLGRLA